MRPKLLGILAAAGVAALLAVRAATPAGDTLQRHRNLGKAFYENPTTHNEAIAEFKKALDLAPNSIPEKLNYALSLLRGGRAAEAVPLLEQVQKLDPKLPYTWFNLGIYFKQNNELEKASAQFEQMVKLVPEEPIAHYQLGTLFRAQGDTAHAAAEFERAAQLNPLLAAAHFQLYNLYRTTGRQPEAAKQLAVFQQLKKDAEGAAVPEDVDWCNYAEIYDPTRKPTSLPGKPQFDERTLGPATGLLALDSTGAGQTDLLTWSPAGIQLYRRGTELVAQTGLAAAKNVRSVAAGDYDNDGLPDLCILTDSGPQLWHNAKGKWTRAEAALPQRAFHGAVWIDYDHDYDLDLVLLGDQSALVRNQGAAGFADRTADFPFVPGKALDGEVVREDLNGKAFDLNVTYEGRKPVLYRDQLGGRYVAGAAASLPAPSPSAQSGDFRATIVDGKARVLLPRRRPSDHWIRVQLAGIKSLKLGQDALVEIKAGEFYSYRMYQGVPLVFDTDGYSTIDVVRITWPNGLIQSETNQPADKSHRYEEAQRLSGSCPMIWTWNGRAFQFITDVLGVAPLGASDGEGSYFPVDHDEYVQIPTGALVARDGRYEVRVTEELSEVSYLDQIQLIAVDHPTGQEIFTNEKFKAPPYPEFRLYSASRRIYPATAKLAPTPNPQPPTPDRSIDVLPLIIARDHRYPTQFARTELGRAEPHTLDLDFPGAPAAAVLLLNGWVDWPDGSTFRAASQEHKGGLTTPYLQMQDASGKWVTVNDDMGMPAGKPKTIAVPLHFLSSSRAVRIVTDLCVYWDEIFLSETPAPPDAHLQTAALRSADLHFRGFSASEIAADRKQPDTFFYGRVEPASFWNPTPGLYTRYGDVRPLLTTVDDRLVLMGSGDEVTLTFDVPAAPPAGWVREFLLKVDGWAKDRDPNTAFSQSVEPLPFHGMSRYPYPATEHYPDDEAHESYRREYNTRPALRLVRPLRPTE